jgi:hypothetical protein
MHLQRPQELNASFILASAGGQHNQIFSFFLFFWLQSFLLPSIDPLLTDLFKSLSGGRVDIRFQEPGGAIGSGPGGGGWEALLIP